MAAPVSAGHNVNPVASAGPDGFGYMLDGTITYSWEDTSTGTHAPFDGTGMNSVLGPFALPSDLGFEFYGEEKTEFWIGSNGYITFKNPGSSFLCCRGDLHHVPSTQNHEDFIAGTGGFLSVDDSSSGCGDVHYADIAGPPRRFIVTFDKVCYQGESVKTSWQIKLYPDGDSIEVHYKSIPACGSGCPRPMTGGIEDKTGSNGLMFFNLMPSYGALNNLAVRYEYPNQPPTANDDGDADGDGVVEDTAYHMTEDTATLDLDVKANDTDPNGDTITVSAVGATVKPFGGVSILADGKVRYELDTTHPTVNALGASDFLTDSFTYTISDPDGEIDTATVTVKITGIDLSPTVVNNTVLSAQEAHAGLAPTPLTLAHVDVDDEDDGPDSVVIKVLTLPAGQLRLGGVAVAVGDLLSRADFALGQLKYLAPSSDPVGLAPHDSFNLTAYDPDDPVGLSVGNFTVPIHIAPYNDLPVADMEVSDGGYFVSLDVTFQDASVPGDEDITAWFWDFGDGSTASTKVAAHTYTEPGNYTVTLRITEGVDTDTVSRTLDVREYVPVTPKFRLSSTEVRAGTAVTFHDMSEAGSIPIETLEWDISGGGGLLEGGVVSHTFRDAGTYRVTLTIIDERGHRFFAQHQVTVLPALDRSAEPVSDGDDEPGIPPLEPPIADAGLDQTVVPGTVARLQGTSEPRGNFLFSWTQVDGPAVRLVGANTPSPMFAVPWVQEDQVELFFRLVVHDGELASLPDDVRIVIRPGGVPSMDPVPDPDAAFDYNAAADGLVQFTARESNLPELNYTWHFEDGSQRWGRDTTFRFDNAGLHAVRLVVKDGFGREARSLDNILLEAPNTPAAVQSSAEDGGGVPWLLLAGILLGATVLGALGVVAWSLLNRR